MTHAPDSGFGVEAPDGLRLLERVGVGRRSQWFRSEQVRLNRVVALKVLRPFLGESPRFRESFLEAGRQAAAMVHPAALPIINIFPRQNALAVTWCAGAPMKERIGVLDSIHVARVGEVVMDCLSSLHATGRCHGNLSGGNIFHDDAEGVWLDDFFQPPVMADGERMFRGDYRFIAPEFFARGLLDWRSDIFSLGAVLAEVLTRTNAMPELLDCLERMQSLRPEDRAGSPHEVLSRFKGIRRAEEDKTGKGATIRRRRMYRRVPGEFEVNLRRRSATPEETATILMRIRNIGESGVFVETADDLLVVGSIIELDFGLKGVEGNVHAFGVVRWKSAPPMPRGVGVQFLEVDQAGLTRLRRFLEDKEGESDY